MLPCCLTDVWRSFDCVLQKKAVEEKIKMQQAITRVNAAQAVMTGKLEACCNQQSSEMRVSTAEDDSGNWCLV